MTELLPIAIDLKAANERIVTHRDMLREALPALKASVEASIKEIDQANQLIVGVDRLQDARDALMTSIEMAAPSLRALFGEMSAGVAIVRAATVEEPHPVVEASIEPAPAGESALTKEPVEEAEPAQEQTDGGLPVDERLSPATQRVLNILRLGAGENGICRMSARAIAEAADVALSTARVGIFPKLKALGLARAENTEDGWVYVVAPHEGISEASASEPERTADAPVVEPAPAIEPSVPVASPLPAPASSQVAKQGRDLMVILRKAPTQEDGSAMFMSSAIAKRLAVTEHRIDQILEHLETVDQIEIQSCALKGHFRISITSAGRVAS